MIIWLSSYPKSGNTWLRSFLVSYYFTRDGEFNFEDLSRIPDYPSRNFLSKEININEINQGEIYKYWDNTQKEILKNKKAKFLKTHNSLNPINDVPFTKKEYTLGIIHIIRDPRNVITSIKNHFGFDSYDQSLKYMQTDGAFMKGEDNARYSVIDSWRSHYTSWMSNRNLKRITIKYEEMEESPEETFGKVVNFINSICKIKEGIIMDKLINSINNTKFDLLKKGEDEGKFTENVIRNNKKIKFFNLGPQNKWKNVLPHKIQYQINEYYKEDLKNLGYIK